jgi:ribosomal protein L21E
MIVYATVRASHAKQFKGDVGLVVNDGKTKYMVAANTQNCSKACAIEI